jgi:hypothetical protein
MALNKTGDAATTKAKIFPNRARVLLGKTHGFYALAGAVLASGSRREGTQQFFWKVKP